VNDICTATVIRTTGKWLKQFDATKSTTERQFRLVERSSCARARCFLFGLMFMLSLASMATGQSVLAYRGGGATPITDRNVELTRELATQHPKKEADQAIVDGWPLYRTERGQEAFNHAMATLKATEGASPPPGAFKGCSNLFCHLRLPRLRSNGWIPAGRIWVSPKQYVLIVHSSRHGDGRPFRRRSRRSMKYFVFHEFHNSTRNTDLYDTISAHNRSVFVPFYMGKQGLDAKGRAYVVVVQVAPHNVVSRHAVNYGSAGPGIEVAKNYTDRLARLQAKAGILIASIVIAAEPHLKAVRHRGSEGRPMLRAFKRRRLMLRSKRRFRSVALPFIPAAPRQVARATGALSELVARKSLVSGNLTSVRSVPSVANRWHSKVVGKARAFVSAPAFTVPTPQLAIRAPAPMLIKYRPVQPLVRASPLTMSTLLQRILREPEQTSARSN
jgi:hypothetical protein